MQEYSNFSTEAWDASLEAYKNRYRIPERLTDEEALRHFMQLGPMALRSLTLRYANKARAQKNMPPIRSLPMPETLELWISNQMEAVDELSGHLGSRTYQTIANGMLTQLRAIEHILLGHHD